MYWPGLYDQLENLVLNCQLCLKYSQFKCKQKPMTSLGQDIPVHPWSKLSTDIFHFEGASNLLILDYTRRFLVVHKFFFNASLHVANQCKLVFSEYGWPDTLISDNGPCYIPQTFNCVMQAFSVNHIISSPYYPWSNGLAEKNVQIVKCSLNKAKEEGKDLYKCLMIYCNTPLQVVWSHPCRSYKAEVLDLDLPMSNAVRKKLSIQPEVIRNIDRYEVLPTHGLHIEQIIMYQDSVTKQWHPAVITSLCQEKRSYIINTSDGVVYRKMQAHLKPHTPQNKKS